MATNEQEQNQQGPTIKRHGETKPEFMHNHAKNMEVAEKQKTAAKKQEITDLNNDAEAIEAAKKLASQRTIQSVIDARKEKQNRIKDAAKTQLSTAEAQLDTTATDEENKIFDDFLKALHLAFQNDLEPPKGAAGVEYVEKLMQELDPKIPKDYAPGKAITFVGKVRVAGFQTVSVIEVTKDTITSVSEGFGPLQAKQMVDLAALDSSMLEQGVELTGTDYQRSLIQQAIKKHNKTHPDMKLKIKAGDFGLTQSYNEQAKTDWKLFQGVPPHGYVDVNTDGVLAQASADNESVKVESPVAEEKQDSLDLDLGPIEDLTEEPAKNGNGVAPSTEKSVQNENGNRLTPLNYNLNDEFDRNNPALIDLASKKVKEKFDFSTHNPEALEPWWYHLEKSERAVLKAKVKEVQANESVKVAPVTEAVQTEAEQGNDALNLENIITEKPAENTADIPLHDDLKGNPDLVEALQEKISNEQAGIKIKNPKNLNEWWDHIGQDGREKLKEEAAVRFNNQLDNVLKGKPNLVEALKNKLVQDHKETDHSAKNLNRWWKALNEREKDTLEKIAEAKTEEAKHDPIYDAVKAKVIESGLATNTALRSFAKVAGAEGTDHVVSAIAKKLNKEGITKEVELVGQGETPDTTTRIVTAKSKPTTEEIIDSAPKQGWEEKIEKVKGFVKSAFDLLKTEEEGRKTFSSQPKHIGRKLTIS